MSEQTMLKIDNIDVFHGSFQALWDVSLEVKSREIIAIIGANSSGKSTLLNAISGILHPAKGSIEFEGKDISSMEPFRIVDLGIAQTPEGRRVFPDMNVLDNLLTGAYSRRARAIISQNLEKVYQLFPILADRKSQLAKTLSGGEQQMLAIGRSLMSDPRLLLLDEMSLGLAPIVVNELYKVLKQIRGIGITILFVEQNVRRSLVEADKAYILETGRIVLSGYVTTLREEERIKKAYFGDIE